MRLLADMHISPRTVDFLVSLGHDVVRVNSLLPSNAADADVVAVAVVQRRVVLTQDLDFSAIIALSGRRDASLITLRLSSSRVEYVNAVLQRVLSELAGEVLEGALITVEDQRIRRRDIPAGEGRNPP